MSFAQLLETMGTLAKAQGTPETVASNKKIKAAAADPENNDDETNADNGGGGDGLAADGIESVGNGGDKTLQKSFLLTMADGSEVEAFDGSELIKALTERLDVSEADLAAATQHNQQTEAQVLKSLQAAVELIAAQSQTLKEQGTMIKSLNERMTVLSATGRGVRSVRSVTEIASTQINKSLNANQDRGALSNSEILVKSLAAMRSGRITGLDATKIETALNLGVTVAPELLSAIADA